MTRVSLIDLGKTWPGMARPALEGLSLEIAKGELVALLGPSGCGKTTALRIIAGLIQPTSGDLRFDGRPVLGLPPERRNAVMVFQNHLLFPHMNVVENVGFGLRMRGVQSADIAGRVDEMLSLVQLPDIGRRKPHELSAGQQQRVSLARALVLNPGVLLLDEPLANLDTQLRAGMRDLIRALQLRLKLTTLFVTHDQEEAAAISDRVALMLDGRLRQVDRPDISVQATGRQGGGRIHRGEELYPRSFGWGGLPVCPRAAAASSRFSAGTVHIDNPARGGLSWPWRERPAGNRQVPQLPRNPHASSDWHRRSGSSGDPAARSGRGAFARRQCYSPLAGQQHLGHSLNAPDSPHHGSRVFTAQTDGLMATQERPSDRS